MIAERAVCTKYYGARKGAKRTSESGREGMQTTDLERRDDEKRGQSKVLLICVFGRQETLSCDTSVVD